MIVGCILVTHTTIYTFDAHAAVESAAQKPVEIITIFIHGIIGARFSLSLYHIFNLVRDKTENTVYEKTIETIRNDSFFYENQPIDKVGLKKLEIEDLKAGNAALLAAYLFDSVDNLTSSHSMQAKHSYYTYGWSGLLSKKARETEAEQFFDVLEQLKNETMQKNREPKIRLIGFSHGGNICAQLVHAKQKKNVPDAVTVDELYLIGTPILDETRLVLDDSLFTRVYNIYSPADHIQKKEFFSGKLFSGQKFKPAKDMPLPTKLTQIELHIQKDQIKKNRYTKKVKNFGATDYSPGHTELWFFGWTPSYYRKDYPLYPLPTFVVLPHIINHIQHVEHSQKPIVVSLHPEQNSMRIGSIEQEFLTTPILDQLKQTTLSYTPAEYSLTEYRAHCKEAYWNAREERAPLPKRR